MSAAPEDPETRRVAELASAVREGRASDAEREELRLYADSDEAHAALARRVEADASVGGAWLARSEADNRLAAAEQTPYTKAERAAGVALVVAGAVGGAFIPYLGLACVAGGALLAFSVLRVKLKTIGKDPYSGIQK